MLPLVELRAEFSVSRVELDDADRGAIDLDLPELDEAVQQIAIGENVAVFHGYGAGGIEGITESTSHAPIRHVPDMSKYPDRGGAGGGRPAPVGHRRPLRDGHLPETSTRRSSRSTEHGGHLLFDHLHQILGGPLVWAPGVDGAVVLSLRGGDFILDSGQDISIGYLDHNADVVRLYLEESFSFRVIEPDAAVAVLSRSLSRRRRIPSRRCSDRPTRGARRRA